MAPRTRQRATVVGVLDGDSWTVNTDNIVVADARRRRLVWIPRDLWSGVAGDRVNAAYRLGGHALFCAALRELGFPVDASVVVQRSAVERALGTLRITVPVDHTRRYWYPMAPRLRLQDGAKLVTFEPPLETLEGERIHQWLGARRNAGTPVPALPDLDRIARQQTFVRRLLEDGFAFSTVLDDPALVRMSDPTALEPLREVRADWVCRTLDDVEPATRDCKHVLVRRRSWFGRLWGGA